MKNIILERELKRMVKRVVREEKLNNINEEVTNELETFIDFLYKQSIKEKTSFNTILSVKINKMPITYWEKERLFNKCLEYGMQKYGLDRIDTFAGGKYTADIKRKERFGESKINENLPRRERERHQTQFAKSRFEPYDREREIMGAFGPYRDDLPPNVVSYLRKNPRRFLQKMVDIYGMDKILDFIGYQQHEVMEDYDNYMGSKKGKKLTASDIKSKMDSFSDSRG